MALRVLIAGAGIGGLCLAQGLRKAGVAVDVFERDASAKVRGQGFRFRIDANGDAALQTCLPSNLYALYRATSNRPAAPPSAAYDHQMQVIFRMSPGGISQHMAVNRRTLREVLMGGLEDVIQFGHALVKVEQSCDEVTATFADGTAVSGDVLVAADGIGSVVRGQMLPKAEPVDTGMRCIYGTTPLDRELLEALPEIFLAGFVPFVGSDRRTLAMGAFRSRRPMQEAAAELAPWVRLTPVQDYLMWLCVAPLESYAMSDEALRAVDCATLQRKALELFQVPIRTSPPLATWPPTRVTLLGDAIHAMTPAGGIGANTALRDAELLAKLLSEADRSGTAVIDAIAQYEMEMRVYGTAAVQQSLEGAARLYRISLPETEVV
jgi:2-polyprenyl-6-methoxyphenol hydroxylase-like FAD-dependent oxidoreductase